MPVDLLKEVYLISHRLNLFLLFPICKNLNHKQDSQTVSSSFIGAKYKDLKVGLATNPGEDSNSAEIAYDYKF